MKTTIQFIGLITILLFMSLEIYSQNAPLQHRGMYVSKFLKFVNIDANPSDLIVDANRSILGVDIDGNPGYEKEDFLIEYCKRNHITYLTLYDCRIPLAYMNENYPGSTLTFGDHLCRFIEKCKTNCIDMIGIAGGRNSDYDDMDDFNNSNFNYRSIPQTPPFAFPSSFTPSPLQSQLNFVTQIIPPSDPRFFEAEMTKLYLRAALFAELNTACNQHIDVLNLEIEFWNISEGDPEDLWPNEFLPVLNHMNTVQANTINPPLYTEVYLGKFELPASVPEQTKADMID